MKKKITTLPAVTVLLVILFGISVIADGAGVNVTLSASVAGAGESVTVTVSAAGYAEAQSLMIEPSYDANVLEITEKQWVITGMLLSDFEGDDGVLAFAEVTNLNQTLAVYTFRVKDDAAAGEAAIGFTVTTQTPGRTVASGSAVLQITAAGDPDAEPLPDDPAPQETGRTEVIIAACAALALIVVIVVPFLLLRRRKKNGEGQETV